MKLPEVVLMILSRVSRVRVSDVLDSEFLPAAEAMTDEAFGTTLLISMI